MRFDSFASRLEAAFSSWADAKLFLERSVSVSTEVIHVAAGVLILLLAAAALRKPVSSWQPWLVVLAFAFVNECVDLAVEQWPEPSMQFGEGVNDLLMTMLLPTVLLLTARRAPWLYRVDPVPPADNSEDEGPARPD